MGIGRWLHKKDVRETIAQLEKLDQEACSDFLPQEFERYIEEIRAAWEVDIGEIMESSSFHIVNDMKWTSVPLQMNSQIRVPLQAKLEAGDVNVAPSFLAICMLLHSVRDVLDQELNGNKDLTFQCRGIVGSCGWAGSKKCILMVI